jgi:hypothetical protein
LTEAGFAVYLTASAVEFTANEAVMLEDLFGSKIRARALAWLVTHPDERYFVRQLTAILGKTQLT